MGLKGKGAAKPKAALRRAAILIVSPTVALLYQRLPRYFYPCHGRQFDARRAAWEVNRARNNVNIFLSVAGGGDRCMGARPLRELRFVRWALRKVANTAVQPRAKEED